MRKAPWFLMFSFLVIILPVRNGKTESSQGWGSVRMAGSIVESACAISANTLNQTVDMGILPVSTIIRDGEGEVHKVSIHLINCSLTQVIPASPNWQSFQITFEGREDNNLFALNGNASGIALQIEDSHHNEAHPGSPLPSENILPVEMTLNFNLRIVSDHQTLRIGNYNATIPFKMDYY